MLMKQQADSWDRSSSPHCELHADRGRVCLVCLIISSAQHFTGLNLEGVETDDVV